MLGFRVCKREQSVSTEWVDKFRTLPVANISDVMSRMTAGGAQLRPFYTGPRHAQ